MFDVITVGSATVDVFAKTEFSELVRDKKKEECIAYPVGSKILIDELIVSSGGGGTNTAASLSSLGHKVAFLGKIGSQENSHRLKLELKKYNIDCSFLISDSSSRTGYSIVLDSLKHDRTILTYRGSNSDLSYDEIDLKRLKTRWFLFTSLRGKSFQTQVKLSKFAVKNDIKIAYILSSYLAKLGIKKLRPLIKNVHILIMNKEEAEILLGKNDINTNLKKMHKIGVKIAVITDSFRGSYVFDGSNYYFGKTNKVKVVETTGAGDAFASAFLSGIIKKNDVSFAIQLGTTQAESVIQYHGAKNKLLSYNEILKVMKKSPVKVVKKKL